MVVGGASASVHSFGAAGGAAFGPVERDGRPAERCRNSHWLAASRAAAAAAPLRPRLPSELQLCFQVKEKAEWQQKKAV